MTEEEFLKLKHGDRIKVRKEDKAVDAEVFTLDKPETVEYITLDGERHFRHCHYKDVEIVE